MSAPSLHPLFPLLLSLFSFFTFTSAQSPTSIAYPTTAAPSATVLASANGYNNIGCWNDTTGFHNNGGARALSGGKSSANNTMTASKCLDYCSTGFDGQTMQYAGLEYGRECYCGAYLSPLSEKLNESARCVYACDGNSSEICGGQLALTLYNLTSGDSKTGIAWSQFAGAPAWYGTLAVITLVVAAVL